MYFRIFTSINRKSIHAFGKDASLLKAAEECSELAQAITKYLYQDWTGYEEEERQKVVDNIIEEVADVFISIVNILEILGLNKFDINKAIERKQIRQKHRSEEMEKSKNV